MGLNNHSVVVMNDGTVKGCGDNRYNQLGLPIVSKDVTIITPPKIEGNVVHVGYVKKTFASFDTIVIGTDKGWLYGWSETEEYVRLKYDDTGEFITDLIGCINIGQYSYGIQTGRGNFTIDEYLKVERAAPPYISPPSDTLFWFYYVGNAKCVRNPNGDLVASGSLLNPSESGGLFSEYAKWEENNDGGRWIIPEGTVVFTGVKNVNEASRRRPNSRSFETYNDSYYLSSENPKYRIGNTSALQLITSEFYSDHTENISDPNSIGYIILTKNGDFIQVNDVCYVTGANIQGTIHRLPVPKVKVDGFLDFYSKYILYEAQNGDIVKVEKGIGVTVLVDNVLFSNGRMYNKFFFPFTSKMKDGPDEEIDDSVIPTDVRLFARIGDIESLQSKHNIARLNYKPFDIEKGIYVSTGLNETTHIEKQLITNFDIYTDLGMTNIQQASCGIYHTLLLDEEANVYGAGYNISEDFTLMQGGIKQISAGGFHSFCVNIDGTLVGIGDDSEGQLGNYSDMTNVLRVSCGYTHTVFLKTDGTVWACGSNKYGQLGQGNSLVVNGIVKVPTIKKAIGVYAGSEYTMILYEDGTVQGCGNNSKNQIGVAGGGMVRSPKSVSILEKVINISCGYEHTLFQTDSGQVWGSGCSLDGQLGLIKNSVAPPIKLSIGDVNSLTTGSNYSAFIKESFIYKLGDNNYGQFGNGTVKSSYDIQRIDVPFVQRLWDTFVSVVSSCNLYAKVSGKWVKTQAVFAKSGLWVKASNILGKNNNEWK